MPHAPRMTSLLRDQHLHSQPGPLLNSPGLRGSDKKSVRGTTYFEAPCYKLSLALTLNGAQTGFLYYSNALHLSHVIFFSMWKQLHSFFEQRGWMCSLHNQGMSEFASFKLFDNFLSPQVTQIVLWWVTQGEKKKKRTKKAGVPNCISFARFSSDHYIVVAFLCHLWVLCMKACELSSVMQEQEDFCAATCVWRYLSRYPT